MQSLRTRVAETWAFEWTSASRLPNGTTIPACPGQDVTMSWSYTAGVAEHLTNVEWHYTPPDQPITTDDQLHVTMLPDAVYVNSTRQYHVQLACGDFLPVWGHRASVVWKTPDNQTLSSTSGENGRFLLSVPNPVVSGEYSCILDDTSPASLCVQGGSPLQRGATVNVDGVQAQFVTLEARYQQENAVLKQQLESQKQEDVAQKQQLENQKQQLENQRQQMETMRYNLTSMIAIADTGTYTVRVNMDVHGSTVREMQSAEVLVSDQPITTDDQLHVTMLPDAVYVNSTRQYHVQLACGDFLPVWGHRASVVWKTPDNQTLPSTSGENGRFLLSVPIPVVTGEYSCILDDTSPASLCVQSGSPLQRGATVNVDGVQAQIVTLEARMNSYQQENSVLKQQLESQKQEVVAQKQQLETQKQQLETQEQEVENQKHRLENQTQQQEIHRQEVHVLKQQLETMRHNLTSMIETAARSVSFHAFQSSSRALNVGDTIVFDQIISNEGGAYNSDTAN
nr:hypothetical protein BaRGS_026993 [Batillaria attramentaria]